VTPPAVTPLAVVAHRGASREHPEHTAAAYRAALDAGADAVECDVRLTADQVLVCVHDRRIDRTSDGHGAVSSLTLAELSRFSFGGAAVLTFEALLGLLREAGRPVGLAVETKHPCRAGAELERAVVLALRDADLLPTDLLPTDLLPTDLLEGPHQVRLMSFSAAAVRRARELAPTLPTVLLVDPLTSTVAAAAWRSIMRLPPGVSAVGPGMELVRRHPELVVRAVEAGQQVHVWTVDERADVATCVELGVSTVITNRPREVRGWLGSTHN